MSEVISIRFDKSRFEVVDLLAKQEHVAKAEAIRAIFDSGRISIAAQLYKENKASLEKAAKIAGLSISEFMDELCKRGIKSNISLEDFKESLKTVKKMIR